MVPHRLGVGARQDRLVATEDCLPEHRSAAVLAFGGSVGVVDRSEACLLPEKLPSAIVRFGSEPLPCSKCLQQGALRCRERMSGTERGELPYEKIPRFLRNHEDASLAPGTQGSRASLSHTTVQIVH